MIEIILPETIPSDIKLTETTVKVMDYGENTEFMDANREIDEKNLSYSIDCIVRKTR